MPLVNLPANPPQPAPGPQPPAATIQAPEYKHSVVDAKVTPLAALLTHVEGSTWVVDYYSQVLGSDEEATPWQPHQAAVYQQYRLIKGYAMKLQGSLSIGSDPTSHEMTVTGTALIYPRLKPNYGDMFIADVGDGLAGMFVIGQPTKKTILTDTAYEVPFTMARIATAEITSELNNCVVDTGYFNKDFLLYGQNPVLTGGATQALQTVNQIQQTLFTRWVTDFYSREFKTFLVPEQDGPCYDSFLTHFMFQIFDRNANPLFRKARELNCAGIPVLEVTSFWSAIVELDRTLLYSAFTNANRLSTTYQGGFPYMDGIIHSGIDTMVAPTSGGSLVDAQYQYQGSATIIGLDMQNPTPTDLVAAQTLLLSKLNTYSTEYPTETSNDISMTSPTVPVIRNIASNDRYVLTQAFFDGDVAGMTKLERLLDQYFNEQRTPLAALFAFCDCALTWRPLERFYYIPILLAMLRLAPRNM